MPAWIIAREDNLCCLKSSKKDEFQEEEDNRLVLIMKRKELSQNNIIPSVFCLPRRRMWIWFNCSVCKLWFCRLSFQIARDKDRFTVRQSLHIDTLTDAPTHSHPVTCKVFPSTCQVQDMQACMGEGNKKWERPSLDMLPPILTNEICSSKTHPHYHTTVSDGLQLVPCKQ